MGKTVIKNEIKVIETGTDEIWTYRKWSDGTAECWGHISKSMSCTTATGVLYYGGFGTINFPNGLFISNPRVIATRNADAQGAGFIQIYNLTNTSYIAELVTSRSLSGPEDGAFYAIGKWK